MKSSIQTQFTPLRKPLRTKLLITMSKILLASVSIDIVSYLGNFNWFNWGGRITHELYSFSSASPATLLIAIIFIIMYRYFVSSL